MPRLHNRDDQADERKRHLEYRLRFEVDDDGRTLYGLAVPFNTPTRISNQWEGTFDEQFAFGSLKRTLSMRTPVLQFEHGTHPMLGSFPIGSFRSIKETKPGLDVVAPLFDNWLVDPVVDAIRGGAITGMSVRFRPIRVDSDTSGDVELRTITEAELIELGPVVFPAYPSTTVDLRHFDINSQIDRRRLAEALLAGTRTADHEIGSEPGTDPSPGSPATADDPDLAPLVGSRRHIEALNRGRKKITSWR